uniref:Serine palmitoyltransferase small subunit B n=3 Tax=Anatinae TaxID=2068716 RepID=A0A8B9VKH9_9AVES
MLINCVNVNKLTQKTQGGVVLRFQLADVFPSQQCPSPEAGSAPRCGSWHRGRTRARSMLGPEKAVKEGACKSSSSQGHWKLKMDIKHVKDYIYWLYYQYLLITCSYVLEPWEQSMFHTITVTVFAMVVYTAYVFVPIHVRLAFEFFSQIFGGQPDSTVSVVN